MRHDLKDIQEFIGYFQWYCSCGAVGGRRLTRAAAEAGWRQHCAELGVALPPEAR